MTLPNPPARPKLKLTYRPWAVEIYTDLQRGRRFLRLCFRRRDLTQRQARRYQADLIADVTRAGLIITGDIETLTSLENVRDKDRVLQSPSTQCKVNIKIQCHPADEASDVEEWLDWLRSRYVPTSDEPENASQAEDD